MTIELLSTSAIQSRITELNALITHMERLSYGHLATTIRADIWILEKEIRKRKK